MTSLITISNLYVKLREFKLLNSYLPIVMSWLLLSLSLTTQAETVVSGAIAVNTTWALSNSPFVVSGDVVVQNGAKLNIEPGVTVYMASNTTLTVQDGSVSALGTAENKIHVASDKVRLSQTPGAGDWGSWIFAPNTSNSHLDYVVFENGKGLIVNGASPTFNYLNIKNNLGNAITSDLKASLSGVGNEASGNAVNGVVVPAGDVTTNVKWGLRGIPYVVSTGVVSVGASPTIASLTPNIIQQGEVVNINLTGSRLDGLTGVSFNSADLTGRVLSGATSSSATIEVTANSLAALGMFNIIASTNAGEAKFLSALTIVPAQPAITNIAPSTVYTNQGDIELTINGRNFTNTTEALINNSVVASQYVSPTQIKALLVNQALATTLSFKLRSPDSSNAGQFLISNQLNLAVNPAQLVITPSNNSVAKGFSKTLTVTLPYPAPANGVNVTLVASVPSVATVPSSVNVLAGAQSASFQLTGVGLGSSVVTASGPGFVSAQAQVNVVPPPTLSITPNVLTLGVGRTANINIQSTNPAGPSGLVVLLNSSNASVATVPSTVTIPAGSTAVTTAISTVALGNVNIQAQADEYVSGSASVTVRPVSINLPSAGLVAPGLTRSIPITLSDPAPAGGLVVNLNSSDTSKVSVPSSMTIAEGQLSANVTLTGVAAGTAVISATATEYQAASMPVTVEAITIGLGSPSVSTVSTPVEITETYLVTLSRPAPTGGVQLNLAITDGTKAAISPASILIPEGQTTSGVVFANVTGISTGTTTLTISSQGLNSVSIPVTVTVKPTLSFNKGTVIVGKGLKTYIAEVNVLLKTGTVGYAPTDPLVVTLTSGDPSKVSVPATVTISANTSSVNFYVTGVDFTNGTPVTIDASAVGYTAPVTKLAATTIAPVYTFQSLDTQRSPASSRDDFYLNANVPGATYPSNQTAAVDLPIDLSIVEANPEGIVDGFYSAVTAGTSVTQAILRAGQTMTYYNANGNGGVYSYVGTPTFAGSYKVQINALGAISTSGVVTVAAPELKFNKNTVIVGKGLNTYIAEVNIARAVNGVVTAGVEPLTVTLTSSDPSKVSVPATVTIPANNSSVNFYVTGVDFTNGTPVTIDASAVGYTAPVTKLAATTIAPVYTFQSLDTQRSPVSSRDEFNLTVSVPGVSYPNNVTAAIDLPIDLSIVNANPEGIVDGFYSATTAGTVVTQAILRAGRTDTAYNATGGYNAYSYIGTPTVAGSYKVQINALGAISTSGVVTVAAPELKFNKAAVITGKGLKTYIHEVNIARAVNGVVTAGVEPLTVTLTSSDPSKVSVPATMTIPANTSSVNFYVTGVDFTNGTPVTIDASAVGYTAPVTKLSATTIAPVYTFQSLDTQRSPASSRDDFYISVAVPGVSYPNNVTAAADLPIGLSIVEANPEGIVDGFYSVAGTVITQVVLKADNTQTHATTNSYSYVGTPTVAGSYKVQANALGAISTSGVVTVAAPALKFNKTGGGAVVVGKGLKTYLNEVYVSRVVNGVAFSGADALTVNLSCNSTAICNVPATVTIPANQSQVYFYVTGVDLGSTTISASAVGYNSPATDLSVNAVVPELNFSGLSTTNNVGVNDSFLVYLIVPGAYYSGNQTAVASITVSLTSSAPGVESVPATVTIPINATNSNSVNATGVSVGTTSITASGSGLQSITSPTITVGP